MVLVSVRMTWPCGRDQHQLLVLGRDLLDRRDEAGLAALRAR